MLHNSNMEQHCCWKLKVSSMLHIRSKEQHHHSPFPGVAEISWRFLPALKVLVDNFVISVVETNLEPFSENTEKTHFTREDRYHIAEIKDQ